MRTFRICSAACIIVGWADPPAPSSRRRCWGPPLFSFRLVCEADSTFVRDPTSPCDATGVAIAGHLSNGLRGLAAVLPSKGGFFCACPAASRLRRLLCASAVERDLQPPALCRGALAVERATAREESTFRFVAAKVETIRSFPAAMRRFQRGGKVTRGTRRKRSDFVVARHLPTLKDPVSSSELVLLLELSRTRVVASVSSSSNSLRHGQLHRWRLMRVASCPLS